MVIARMFPCITTVLQTVVETFSEPARQPGSDPVELSAFTYSRSQKHWAWSLQAPLARARGATPTAEEPFWCWWAGLLSRVDVPQITLI